jgi:hypothetical protein
MFKQPAKELVKNLVPYLILSVAPLCWSGNIILARGVADLIPPVAFAFWRWTLAFVLILPFTLCQLAHDRHELNRRWNMLFGLAARRVDPGLPRGRHGAHRRRDGTVLLRLTIIYIFV